jgi:hypothetical protein
MPFDMYGDVILTRDVTERGLRAGDVGTVVERHSVPSVPEEGYSVEFFDMTGNTVAVARCRRAPCACPHQPIGPLSELSARELSNYQRQTERPSYRARPKLVWGSVSPAVGPQFQLSHGSNMWLKNDGPRVTREL